MDVESIIATAVGIALGLALFAKLLPKRRPPRKSFRCARCGSATLHNDRTAGAWRDGKTKFFCKACHLNWLQSRAPQERLKYPNHASRHGGSGCLGIVLLFPLIPLGVLLFRAYV